MSFLIFVILASCFCPSLPSLKAWISAGWKARMTKKGQNFCFYFAIFCFFSSYAVSLTVGSNNAVARQGLVTFPAADSDNRMLGFSRFNSGFTLQDSTTSCTFDSVFPVSGTINLNGGNLYLTEDLILNNNFQFNSCGQIWGNGYSLELSVTNAPFVIPMLSNTVTYTALYSIAEASQNKSVKSVSWSYDGLYIAASTDTASGVEVNVYSFNGTTLSFVASKEINKDVLSIAWHPSSYDLMVVAKDIAASSNSDIVVYRLNVVGGTLDFVSGVDTGATSYCGAWRPDGNYIAVLNKEKKLSACSYNGTTVTLLNTTTTDLDAAFNAITWSPDGNYIATGSSQTGGGKNDIKIWSFNGSLFTEIAGAETGLKTGSLDWMQTTQGSFIAAGLYAAGSNLFRVYKFDSYLVTLTEQVSARDGETSTIYSVQWSPDKNFILLGLANTGVNEIEVYKFEPNTVTVGTVLTRRSSFNIFAARWSPDQNYIATGDSNSILTIYGVGSIIAESIANIPLLLDMTKVVLACPVYVRTPINTRNFCVISGRGNELRLLSGGSINVKPGGTLVLEDLILSGLSLSNLGCNFSSSNIILRNCWLQFSNNFTFSIGSLNFDQDVYLTGSVTFNYTSPSSSMINSNATLNVSSGMTFNYAPAAANKNLIVMQDSTASLFLEGSTLSSTTTGLRLDSGSLYFHNCVTLTNQANNLAQGMEFGANLSIHFLSKSFVNLFGFYKYGT